MGSVIDGEDVVQDTFARAIVALDALERGAAAAALAVPDRPQSCAGPAAQPRHPRREPIEAALEIADDGKTDPMERMMRRQAIETAVSRFTELPILQRSVIILKDVLDEPLAEIADLLDISVDAVKAHLARGRARLRQINARAAPLADARIASAAVVHYVTLFNRRDWDGLRALLADDVKLHQSLHPPRSGAADVGMFFTVYAKSDSVWLAPAWLEGREVIAVFENRADPKPSYFMRLEWRPGLISFIRDYRYISYIADDAEFVL